jgi:hypothetical protein
MSDLQATATKPTNEEEDGADEVKEEQSDVPDVVINSDVYKTMEEQEDALFKVFVPFFAFFRRFGFLAFSFRANFRTDHNDAFQPFNYIFLCIIMATRTPMDLKFATSNPSHIFRGSFHIRLASSY